MLHLANLTLIGLLLVNLAGLSVIAYGMSGSWLLARAASPVLVAIPFFIEHFWGFGLLAWAWPVTTTVSAGLIVLHWDLLKKHWRIEAVFHAAFAYALAWRYSFPDIYASSEKICDVTFVANYIRGDRLPPVDRWLPPFAFDMYYAMQHYAAALLGRILQVPAGTAYNLAICVIAAAVVTAAAGTAWLLVRREGPALLLTMALVFGGTGASPFIRLVTPSPQLHSSIRFIGSSLSPKAATRPFGRWLLHADKTTEANTLDLPVELFSYLVGLGDYHPPLSGYLLLMLALLSMAMIEAGEAVRAAHAVLAATVPLTIPSNAWDFPAQALLVAGYLLYRLWARKKIPWTTLAAGAGTAAILIYPFVIRFAPHADSLHNVLRLVPHGLHTPPVAGLLVFYPLLAILLLNAFFGERTKESSAFCMIWLVLMTLSEFVFVDDLYGGKFERFNTTLKWWAWIYSGTLLTVGAINLRSASRICRWGTGTVLVLISAYGLDLFANLENVPKPHLGQLDGAAWLRDDPAQRAMLDFLKTQPQSVVLQRLPDRAYIAAPSLIIFAGQTALLGWANHEDTWRGYRADIDLRMDAIRQFYSGELPDAERWLELNHVKYVLWMKDDNDGPAGTFEKIDQQIRGQYFWNDYTVLSGLRVGLWSLDGRQAEPPVPPR
jgi:uncharacterized membrane protein